MQQYIDLIIKFWFIFLPLIIAIIIIATLLIRKGYLQEINIFGFKFDFRKDEINKKKLSASQIKNSPSLRDYKVFFTDTALEHVSALKLTQETIISLVESEFTHHINYFKWDLSDYPLPVKAGYIIVLDKVEDTVTFRAVKRADINELELASVNDLLSLYRRLSRFEYRLSKNYILRPETVNAIIDQHKEVIKRLIRHYELFKKVVLPEKEKFPALYLKYLSGSTDLDTKTIIGLEKLPLRTKGFGHNVVASISALYDIEELITNEENGLISQNEADKEVVFCLERSLQYIHKMINACLE